MNNLHASPKPHLVKIFLYGAPGSGKSTVGRLLAEALDLPFWDLDNEIQRRSQRTIPEIFQKDGEAVFRNWEDQVLDDLLIPGEAVIALGGGALLDSAIRARVESCGRVIFLQADPDTIIQRLQQSNLERPLLHGNPAVNLGQLLERRVEHYTSFRNRLSVETAPEEIVWQAQCMLGCFRVLGMGKPYDVRVQTGGLVHLGEMLKQRGIGAPMALISDERVAGLHAPFTEQVLRQAGYPTRLLKIPTGERYKTPQTILELWHGMVAAGLERGSSVVALGGGVVSDLAGFAAATFLRGITWSVIPTSLLGMVDASLGGKTGMDLVEGKNLVGAFHAPRLVLADPDVLLTLPPEEWRSGMAEVVKHGVIADPTLFEMCAQPEKLTEMQTREELVKRAMAVKIRVIQQDPYEKGARAALNLGHTIGHAIEAASDYQLRHGEAISIGTVMAARLAERLGLADKGLSAQISEVLAGLGLPTRIPGDIRIPDIIERMRVDKKRASGRLRFALPARIGAVQAGIEVGVDDIPWEE